MEKAVSDSSKRISKKNVKDILPLTPIQEGMLLYYLQNPVSELYFEQLSLYFYGNMSAPEIKEAWESVVLGNDALRSLFRWEKLDKPVQIFLKEGALVFAFHDLRGSGKSDAEQRVKQILKEDRAMGFDLTETPFRIGFCSLPDNNHVLIMSHHHILYDGWSTGILLKEFLSHLNRTDKEIPHVQKGNGNYKLFADSFKLIDKNKEKTFWQKWFEGIQNRPLLPRKKRTRILKREMEEIVLSFPEDLVQRIKDFSKDNNLTQATFLYSTWGIVLQKWCNSNDVLMGWTISGRQESIPGIEQLVGLFINTLPLRIKTSAGITVLELIQWVSEQIRLSEEFRHSSLVDIKEYSSLKGREDLFESIMVIENYPLDDIFSGSNDLTLQKYEIHETTNFPLTIGVSLLDGIQVKGIFDNFLFDAPLVKKYLESWFLICRQILGNPNTSVASLSLVPDNAAYQFIYGKEKISGAKAVFKKETDLTKPFFKNRNSSLSFNEAENLINILASVLFRKFKDNIPVIYIDSSINTALVVLAAQEAGITFIPLFGESAKETGSIRTVIFADKLVEEALNDPSTGNAEILTGEKNKYFCIIPSIADGVSSGEYDEETAAKIPFDNFGFILDWYDSFFELSDAECFLIWNPANIISYLVTLFFGRRKNAAFYMSSSDASGVDDVLNEIRNEGITFIDSFPDAFYPLIHSSGKNLYKDLIPVRNVIFRNDNVKVKEIAEWLKSFNCHSRVFSISGPIEFLTSVFIREIKGRKPFHVYAEAGGEVIAGMKCALLDSDKNALPEGVPGTAVLSIHSPDRHSEVFVEESRTAVRSEDGVVELKDASYGRLLSHGFFLDLNMVEKILLEFPLLLNIKVLEGEKDNELFVFYISDVDLNKSNLIDFAEKNLPSYIRVMDFIQVKKIPLNIAGFRDVSTLKNTYEQDMSERVFEAPGNEVQKDIAAIWQEILEVDRVSIYDNFFDIGGNSIKLIRMHGKIEKKYPGCVKGSDLFSNTTIAKLAAFIEEQMTDDRDEITLPSIVMPEEYFAQPDGTSILRNLKIDKKILSDLEAIALKEALAPEDFYLGFFIYILSEISGEKKLSFLVMDCENVFHMSIDTGEFDDFLAFQKFISSNKSFEKNSADFSVKNISFRNVKKERFGISFVFSFQDFEFDEEMFKWGDLFLCASRENSKKLFFDSSRINQEEIDNLIHSFVNTLEAFTSLYRNE